MGWPNKLPGEMRPRHTGPTIEPLPMHGSWHSHKGMGGTCTAMTIPRTSHTVNSTDPDEGG